MFYVIKYYHKSYGVYKFAYQHCESLTDALNLVKQIEETDGFVLEYMKRVG